MYIQRMPINIRDPWYRFCGKLENATVAEEEIIVHCLYMLLGTQTDYFQLQEDLTVTVDRMRVDAIMCAHISNGALVKTLERVAEIGTTASELRRIVRTAQGTHGNDASLLAEQGSRLLQEVAVFVKQNLTPVRKTLIRLLADIKPLYRTMRTFIRFSKVLRAPQEFAAECALRYARGTTPLESALVRELVTGSELTRNAHPSSEIIFIAPTLLCHPAKRPISPSLAQQPQSKEETYFICYVWENRIVSH